MNEMKIQRCNYLPEGEMAIIKDTNTLIHNIVNSELKQKDKEIDRLNKVIKELEKSWKQQQEHYRYVKDNRYRRFLSMNLDKLKELKGDGDVRK